MSQPLEPALVRPGGVLAFALFLSRDPGVHVLGGSWAMPQPLPAKRRLAEANQPGSGSSWLAQASRSCRPPPSKRKTCFSLSFVFPSHKRPGARRGRPLLSRLAAGRSLCQIGPGRALGAPRAQTSHCFPGSSPGHSFAFSPFPSPSSCTHSSSRWARLPRRAASLLGGEPGLTAGCEAGGTGTESKEESVSAIGPDPETRRLAEGQRLAPKPER